MPIVRQKLVRIAFAICLALPWAFAFAEPASASTASQLESLSDTLRAAYNEADAASADLKSAASQLTAIKDQYNQATEAIKSAKEALNAVQEARSGVTDVDLALALLSGKATPAEADSYDYLLSKVEGALQEGVTQAEEGQQGIVDEYNAALERFQAEQASIQSLIDACTAAADDLDAACASAKQQDGAISDAYDAAQTEAEAQQLAATYYENENARQSAQALAGEWYDIQNSLGGASGALTFGTGTDFALSEDDFVAKWGTAINSFYAAQEASMGRTLPLAGQGETMARSAYRHRIDPRLCAAVSMAESSGGLYCIRSHNAWGWGAADSDPYNLASEWSSWDEAIEAWHEGMASSTTGLATAATVTALGDVYATDPAWPAHVLGFMSQIG